MSDSNEVNHVRVVATYTTLPSRYDVLKRSIQSLQSQTYKLDAIYLAIAKKAARLNKEYPPIPEDIASMCTIVNIDTDYGPITKIYGALVSETDPNTVIFSCDDDVLFEPNHVEKLVQYHKIYPKSAICGTGALISRGLPFISIVSTVKPYHTYAWKRFTGFDVDKNGRKIDLLFGVAGVLYTRGMFPSNDKLYDEILQYSLIDDSIFHNDDVLISGYLSKQNIERRVFLDIPAINHVNGQDALSGNLFKMITRLNTSIYKVKEFGFFPTMEPLSLDETPAGRGVIIIILLIIIIFLCIYLYMLL